MTTTAAPPAETAGLSRPCNRCKEQEGTIDLRGAEVVCKSCFAYYVTTKAVKRLEVLQRETASPIPPRGSNGPKSQRRTQRYLIALSCGPSSTALLHVLFENLKQQRARGRKVARFEYVAAHIIDDTSSTPDSAEDLLSSYRAQFPDLNLVSIPLSSALDLTSINWVSLPSPTTSLDSAPTPPQRLSQILHHLPSTTSRADVRRFLTRHLLVAAAVSHNCDALLLGHSTTSLAELTLSEAAKGRGFSLPFLVNDGSIPLPANLDLYTSLGTSTNSPVSNESKPTPATTSTTLPIYSPLRELFRKELITYLRDNAHPLAELLHLLPSTDTSSATNTATTAPAVVSHRDLSIDEVLLRYFADVETNYPSVVANVVRTTGKLLRRPNDTNFNDGDGEVESCGLCGTALDELGDERWKGEIGEREQEEMADGNDDGVKKPKSKLCYGCERSVHG
ncbi:uncharacterized protein F4822DRAFT_415768 [Hypoxylon trugodes]|uniref:uncharacterized protein n=1 Tax=Hypoxylon trugodes TaxID=326681 RepID=UPI002190D783|nr:uncharacterized protein F4822DRAFT_415768 [Hypoxylon trugodes]KAI1384641.1 hypothetical protein F4822DRAFT_415768 [Hypoxylon trugodes]